MSKRRRTVASEDSSPTPAPTRRTDGVRTRELVRGVIRELGVIQTPDGDFIGFPLLTVLNAPIGAEFIGIVVEPAETDSDHEPNPEDSELGD